MRKSAARLEFDLPHILGAVFLLALLVRLIFDWQWFQMPYGDVPFLDAQAYDNWAQAIAAGQIFRPIAFYISPLLPYPVGLLYAVFGHSLWLPALLNTAAGAATCVLLARLAFLAFGPLAAITTGVLTALYKPFLFYTPSLMKETLVLFLMALFVSFLYGAFKTNSFKNFIWSGISLGLCAIGRGNVLWFIPVIPLFIYWQNRPARLKNAGAFLLGACIAILPITLHNAIASRDFVLLSYSDGFNAYIGHNPAATGTSYVFPPEVTSSPEREEFDVTFVASQALGRPLKPSEVSAWWRDKAVDYILAHPGREFLLLFKKLGAFWSNDEPFDNYDMRFIAGNFDTLMSWPLPGFGFAVFLAIIGVWGLRKRYSEDVSFFFGVTVTYMLTLLPFYVTDRYRLPVVICFLPLAGGAVPAVQAYLHKKNNRELAALTAIALFVFGLTMWFGDSSEDAAYNWSALSTMYEDEGRDVAAIIAFDRAVAIDPHRVGSDAWIKISDAQQHLGRPKVAEELLRKATEFYPKDGSVAYNYGRVRFLAGDYPAAFLEFKKAVEESPTFTLSYRGLAAVYDHYGQRAAALEAVRRGLSIVPGDASLTEVLEQLLRESGT